MIFGYLCHVLTKASGNCTIITAMAKTEEVRCRNLNTIRHCFTVQRTWHKNELMKAAGISRGAVVSLLQELMENHEILQKEDAVSTGGRPSQQYFLNPDGFHIGCFFLKNGREGSFLQVKVLNLYGNVLAEEEQKDIDAQAVLQTVIKMQAADPLLREVLISVPGVASGGLIRNCDISALENTDLGAMIKAAAGMDPVIENDVNTAAVGLFHALGSEKNLAVIYQPSAAYAGVGLIIAGNLYNGKSHSAGEVRYLPFYSEKEQEEKLQADPAGLLSQEIETIAALLNPSVIGWDSDCIEKLDVRFRMPEADQPRLIRIDMSEMMLKGMYAMAMRHYETQGE